MKKYVLTASAAVLALGLATPVFADPVLPGKPAGAMTPVSPSTTGITNDSTLTQSGNNNEALIGQVSTANGASPATTNFSDIKQNAASGNAKNKAIIDQGGASNVNKSYITQGNAGAAAPTTSKDNEAKVTQKGTNNNNESYITQSASNNKATVGQDGTSTVNQSIITQDGNGVSLGGRNEIEVYQTGTSNTNWSKVEQHGNDSNTADVYQGTDVSNSGSNMTAAGVGAGSKVNTSDISQSGSANMTTVTQY